MENLLLTIDPGTVDWSRAQFALTAIYHWLFVPLTLGLAVIMGIMETCYYRTRKDFWRTAARFWQRLFGINFAMGVATGIILEFEFGTNWSNYSWFVGDIFGAPLAIEGILAFFMESTFVAVMFFGWNKVSAGFHLASTWLTGLGATISAWWILVANAWMQYPVGCTFNPETMRNEMTSFFDVALSPFAIDKFMHTVTSAWVLGAAFTVGVGCWYLLRRRHAELATQSIKIGSIVGLAASFLAAFTGDNSAYMVAQTQPMKLAAMEALYEGGNSQGLTGIALVNPFGQPDYMTDAEPPMRIAVPNMLSLLATHDPDGFVPGVRDIIKGYPKADGTQEPSLKEKQERGRKAIQALKDFRAGKDKEANRKVLERDMKYFGYGYIKDADQLVPFIPVNFWAFRIMVGLGALFILVFAVLLFVVYRKDITRPRWLQMLGIALIPLAYIASESGWLVAEFGRQPWTIQDMLPTWAAVSDLSSGGIAFTFFLFLFLFTAMLAVEVSIMCKQIKKGPEL
ncbi:cytochrome ubiquinol oxidase subunit I [Prevotella multiformis]|uniref:Bacterial cytochrome ubiquinol oxidase n=1 Tax=Prevotella multiformis DSM 16608 TaxID=888743 RepID=F0F5L7_9BACT|nr:cytochrome ubiquinol oxidase subunit I [Prevotella multiformis]EGC20636.1 bacterial cytochrome ubiquinol oxidase [Prevotella multiformis DSM 16608]